MTAESSAIPRRRRIVTLRRAAVVLAIVATGLAVWAFFIEPNRLQVRHEQLQPPRWPTTLDGLRVVVLSDLHVGAPHIGVDKLAAVVDEANAAEPDLVVILGDLVIQGVVGGDFVEPAVTARHLGRLQAKHGVYAVLGNHDWWHDGAQITSILESVGIEVLEDEATSVAIGDTRLWIAGVGDLMTRAADVDAAVAAVPADAPSLLLSHNPDVFVDVPDRISLSLAGHTHGGQVCLPVIGAPIVPSHYGQRFVKGHIIEQGRHLYVSVGVGTSILPVRFGVPPAIDVLTLRSAP